MSIDMPKGESFFVNNKNNSYYMTLLNMYTVD